jgi:hypothetical protein
MAGMEKLHAKYDGKTVEIFGRGTLLVRGNDVFFTYETQDSDLGLQAHSIPLTPQQLSMLIPNSNPDETNFLLHGVL